MLRDADLCAPHPTPNLWSHMPVWEYDLGPARLSSYAPVRDGASGPAHKSQSASGAAPHFESLPRVAYAGLKMCRTSDGAPGLGAFAPAQECGWWLFDTGVWVGSLVSRASSEGSGLRTMCGSVPVADTGPVVADTRHGGVCRARGRVSEEDPQKSSRNHIRCTTSGAYAAPLSIAVRRLEGSVWGSLAENSNKPVALAHLRTGVQVRGPSGLWMVGVIPCAHIWAHGILKLKGDLW